jgi:RNA-directed DNA polymerase
MGELAKRGHAIARYADDGNVHVQCRLAAERIMTLSCHFRGGLRLRIDEAKSVVARLRSERSLGPTF